MSKNYKKSYKVYSAWNYQKEIEDLNAASQQGWQLVHGGCFHSKFVNNPGICYRYQLDYGKIEDMGRYIETFREQGWEYVNSTFNGWHYFRKLYDPAQPEEEYEIFSDRESLHEMNNRWARLALFASVLLGLCAAFSLFRFILQPTLPRMILLLTVAFESAALLRGWFIMRNPDVSRSRRGDGYFLAVFFIVIILGVTSSIILELRRPKFTTSQMADSVDEPVIDNHWMEFQVYYPDNYFLDLDITSKAPLTFEVTSENGESIYKVTETDFHQEDIRLKLTKGQYYYFSMSCDAGYQIYCELD